MRTNTPAMTRRLVALAIAFSFGGIAAAVVAATPEPTATRAEAEVKALSLDVTGGRWSFIGRGVTIKEAATAIAAKAPVDIRIQDPSLEAVKIGIAFQSLGSKEAIAQVLHGFNYAQF